MPAVRTVIANQDDGAVTLRALANSFHRLRYTVSVEGAEPLFVLLDVQVAGIQRVPPQFPVSQTAAAGAGVLLVSDGEPRQTYERVWPDRSLGELDALASGQLHKHVLGMSFIKAVTYRFKVELLNRRNQPLKVLTDIEWSAQDPATERFEAFDVSIF